MNALQQKTQRKLTRLKKYSYGQGYMTYFSTVPDNVPSGCKRFRGESVWCIYTTEEESKDHYCMYEGKMYNYRTRNYHKMFERE